MYLQMQGKTREEAIEEAKPDAEQGLRREAVLEAVAEAEGIEVSEEEMLEALEPPAGEKGKPEKLLKRLRKEGRDALLIEEIRLRKASDLLVESAKPVAARGGTSRAAAAAQPGSESDSEPESEGEADRSQTLAGLTLDAPATARSSRRRPTAGDSPRRLELLLRGLAGARRAAVELVGPDVADDLLPFC